MEEARAIALQAAAEQREKLMARAREAEAAKAAAEAAEAAPPALGPSPSLASSVSGALNTAGTPEVCCSFSDENLMCNAANLLPGRLCSFKGHVAEAP